LLVYDPDENVTLGEDAGQLALIDDRQNANPELNHHGDRCGNGLGRGYAVHGRVLGR
jgi:hypothetical protein